MEVMSRLLLRGMVVAAGLAGCNHQTPPPSPPEFSVPLCAEPRSADFGCTPNQCGDNSPIVNGFPINGLSKAPDGACNPSGVQLIPHSLQGGDCGSGADLGLDSTGTRLIGTRLGKVVCTGEQLTGASFLVRSFARATQIFTITNVRQITMIDGAKKYEGYRIEGGGGSVCEPAIALHVRRQLGLVSQPEKPASALPVPAGYEFGPHDDLVIAVDGPLYDHNDKLRAGSREHWFNLACAGDALAKRSLYDLYTADDDARNDTALRMLTANYCGKPYTVPGIELEWAKADAAGKTLQHEEARWHAGRAICLDTPRLATLHVTADGKKISPRDFPAQLQPGSCKDHACNANQWIAALRAECQLRECGTVPKTLPYEFDSWSLDSGENHIILAGH